MQLFFVLTIKNIRFGWYKLENLRMGYSSRRHQVAPFRWEQKTDATVHRGSPKLDNRLELVPGLMSLIFFFFMLESTTWKNRSILPCVNSLCWRWYNDVWDVFLEHGLLVPTQYCLRLQPAWVLSSLVVFQWLPLSQSSNQLKLVSWTWQWDHCFKMASTATRYHFSRAPLGCDAGRFGS